jgi:hypothetical protein
MASSFSEWFEHITKQFQRLSDSPLSVESFFGTNSSHKLDSLSVKSNFFHFVIALAYRYLPIRSTFRIGSKELYQLRHLIILYNQLGKQATFESADDETPKNSVEALANSPAIEPAAIQSALEAVLNLPSPFAMSIVDKIGRDQQIDFRRFLKFVIEGVIPTEQLAGVVEPRDAVYLRHLMDTYKHMSTDDNALLQQSKVQSRIHIFLKVCFLFFF